MTKAELNICWVLNISNIKFVILLHYLNLLT